MAPCNSSSSRGSHSSPGPRVGSRGNGEVVCQPILTADDFLALADVPDSAFRGLLEDVQTSDRLPGIRDGAVGPCTEAETDAGFSSTRESSRTLQHATQLSAHVLVADRTQFISQLYARLMNSDSLAIRAFLKRLRAGWGDPWLRLLSPTVAVAGGPLLRTIRASFGQGALTADRRYCVALTSAMHLEVWDLETGAMRFRMPSPCRRASYITLSVTPGGERVFLRSRTGRRVEVWDLRQARRLIAITPVSAAAMTDDGAALIYVTDEESVLSKRRREYVKHRRSGLSPRRKRQPINERFVGEQRAGMLKALDLDTGQEQLSFDVGPAHSVTPTFDGKRAVLLRAEGMSLWDLSSKTLVWEHERTGHRICALHVSQDDSVIMSAAFDGTVRFWDLDSGRLECSMELEHLPRGRWKHGVDTLSFPRFAFATPPGVRRVLQARSDRQLSLHDLEVATSKLFSGGHGSAISSLALTPDARRAASASAADGITKIWDLEPFKGQFMIEGHGFQVNTVSVAARATRVITSSEDNVLKIWDIHTGAIVDTIAVASQGRHFESPPNGVRTILFTPDEHTMLIGHRDGRVGIWDPDARHRRHLITAEGGGTCQHWLSHRMAAIC